MENNKQYDERLLRYLANEVNREERIFVEEWIDAEDDNRRYFLQLKDVWQLSSAKNTLDYVLDEMNVDQKWREFGQRIKAREMAGQAKLEEHFKQEIAERKSGLYKTLVRTAVAASLVLIIGVCWKFLIQTSRENISVQHATKEKQPLAFDIRRVVNSTGNEKRIQMSDGSLIVLADNSEITYREPFFSQREISLIGKCYFKVAKDKTRPFTVVSGELSTTALGTEFTVTAFEKDKLIIVRLYHGKVLVRASKKMLNEVYLLPGQEFIYDRQPKTKLKVFKLEKLRAPEQILNEERSRDNPDIPMDERGSWYMFNNQHLAQVLDQFSALYNVPIVYDKRDVKNIGHLY